MRRVLLWLVCGALWALLLPLPWAGASAEPATPGVIDLHVDLPYRVNFKGASLDQGTGQYPARALRQAGVVGVVLPLYVPRDVSPTGPRATDLARSAARILELLPQTPPYSPPGCGAAGASVRTWLAFEGAAPLAADPGAVPAWIRRGVRIFGLVHTYDNALATSSGRGQPAPFGLTNSGREVVRRVHEEGGILDVSHASDAATDEMIALARKAGRPIVATHSNARALAPHPRNLTDAQIRGIAATGGVVGVNFHSPFLVPHGRAKLADVVRQVRHIARVAGVGHVAIGSDFEGGIRPPKSLATVRGFPALARALREEGLSAEAVSQIFHRNALRVLCPGPKHPR